VEDQAANHSKAVQMRSDTPEQVVGSMSGGEIQELLSDLGMQADPGTAQRLRILVIELGNFELAIEAIGGPACMRALSKPVKPAPLRRAA
jgi:hypothetical protein